MMVLIQQFTGINVVLYYASQIFAGFGLSGATTTFLATGVTGVWEALFTFPAVLYLDIYGRKTFLIAGAIGMCICHIVVASIEGVYEDQWKLKEGLAIASGWVAIVFISLSAVNFVYSWGPVTWVLSQEIFPASIRYRGVSLVASTNWMFNFVIGLTTKDMLDSMEYDTYIFFPVSSAEVVSLFANASQKPRRRHWRSSMCDLVVALTVLRLQTKPECKVSIRDLLLPMLGILKISKWIMTKACYKYSSRVIEIGKHS